MAGLAERSIVMDSTRGTDSVQLDEEVRTGWLCGEPGLQSYDFSADVTQAAAAPLAMSGATSDTSRAGEEKSSRANKNGKKGKKKTQTTICGIPSAYIEFRRVCDAILVQVRELESLVGSDGCLAEGWEGAVLEIEALLYTLRGVRWGHADSLKRWVTAILFQVANAAWDARHVKLLRDATRSLRVRYVVDPTAVDECVELIKLHGLDPFRGTTTRPDVRTRYKVITE